MSSGDRPIGAAKGKQSDPEALCQPPPPPPAPPPPRELPTLWTTLPGMRWKGGVIPPTLQGYRQDKSSGAPLTQPKHVQAHRGSE